MVFLIFRLMFFLDLWRNWLLILMIFSFKTTLNCCSSGRCCPEFSNLSQQTFQRCFNVIFWLIWRHDVGQGQINFETTLCISSFQFAMPNNVESTLRISTLMWTTLNNVETTLTFSTSSFIKLINVETTLWKWPFPKKKQKKNHFKLVHWIQSSYSLYSPF